jgi:nucleoid-associated protein YgaU
MGASPSGVVTIKPSAVNATLVTVVPGGPRPAAGAAAAAGTANTRFHVVEAGDSLAKISALFYGTPARWGDILAANRDVLGENNNLVVGRTLRIP